MNAGVEAARRFYSALPAAVEQGWSDWYAAVSAPFSAAGEPLRSVAVQQRSAPHRHHQHDGECADCHDCAGQCRCCLPEDVDLVVPARAGERRVIPLRLGNDLRRERTVTPTLGPWTSAEPSATDLISASLDQEGAITLGPCETRILGLVIEVSRDQGKESDNRIEAGCVVVLGSLALDGCTAPALRIAVEVLSDSCSPIAVRCSCGCC